MNCALPNIRFDGHDRFVRAVDTAVVQGDEHAVTAALRGALCEMIGDPQIHLPACVYDPIAGHYARRELYRSPEHGYSVVAMTWAPGQGTPVHDHCGLWCVEGVWSGALDITQYELLERDGERFRFRTAGGMQAGAGSAGSLIPPHEYHTIGNPDSARLAVSVHVYQAPLQRCARFAHEHDDWYRRSEAALGLDALD